jgi:chromate transport protein ChrA
VVHRQITATHSARRWADTARKSRVVPECIFPVRAGTEGSCYSIVARAVVLAHGDPVVELFSILSIRRIGGLGGHVVLPLLSEAVVEPGWVSQEAFLAGYGAAQAVPGPLFSVAAYLGAVAKPAGGIGCAMIALVAIFLPGILVHVAALPFWSQLRSATSVQASMRGINAAVVGILAAALYQPVWTNAVLGKLDFAIALRASVARRGKLQPCFVVLLPSSQAPRSRWLSAEAHRFGTKASGDNVGAGRCFAAVPPSGSSPVWARSPIISLHHSSSAAISSGYIACARMERTLRLRGCARGMRRLRVLMIRFVRATSTGVGGATVISGRSLRLGSRSRTSSAMCSA